MGSTVLLLFGLLGISRNQIYQQRKEQGVCVGTNSVCHIKNDQEKGVNNKVAKYADETKLFKVIKNKMDYEDLQKNLALPSDWATKWKFYEFH